MRLRHAVIAALVALGMFAGFHKHRGLVLYAQSLPSAKHATWTPNPTSQNVTQYVVTLDGANPVTLPATSCTATLCTASISIPTFGNHTAAVVAQNLALSTDPTSLQSSPATSVTFSLNQAATAPSGTNITN